MAFDDVDDDTVGLGVDPPTGHANRRLELVDSRLGGVERGGTVLDDADVGAGVTYLRDGGTLGHGNGQPPPPGIEPGPAVRAPGRLLRRALDLDGALLVDEPLAGFGGRQSEVALHGFEEAVGGEGCVGGIGGRGGSGGEPGTGTGGREEEGGQAEACAGLASHGGVLSWFQRGCGVPELNY